jgi:hypothetical protein
MARKLKAQKPPLSALDNAIYLGAIVFFMAVFSLALYSLAQIPSVIAFRDEAVVGIAGGSAILLLALPWYMFSAMVPPVVLSIMMSNRQPIVGNRRFKPKFGQPVIKVYPLFSRELRESLPAARRVGFVRTAVILLVIFLVLAALIPFGIYQRATLDRDDVISEFGVRNQVKNSFAVEDADDILIRIEVSGRRSHRTYLSMTLVFGDEEYKFTPSAFHKMSTAEALRYMIRLKELAPDKVEISRTDRMERLLRDYDYSAAEIALIYELFEYNQ